MAERVSEVPRTRDLIVALRGVSVPVDGSGPAVENQQPEESDYTWTPSDEPFADPKFRGNGGRWPGF